MSLGTYNFCPGEKLTASHTYPFARRGTGCPCDGWAKMPANPLCPPSSPGDQCQLWGVGLPGSLKNPTLGRGLEPRWVVPGIAFSRKKQNMRPRAGLCLSVSAIPISLEWKEPKCHLVQEGEVHVYQTLKHT